MWNYCLITWHCCHNITLSYMSLCSQVRGVYMQRGMHSFVQNLRLACDRIVPTSQVDKWSSDGLRNFAAKTVFDGLFNSIFGRQEATKIFRFVELSSIGLYIRVVLDTFGEIAIVILVTYSIMYLPSWSRPTERSELGM